MPLSLLDEKVRSRLRSGVAITSMAQCVGELVENAIDAEAKCIAVRIDVSKYKIQVIDNGGGVTRKDLDLIGQRYATSKCHTTADLDHSLQHLGYRGEALASTINCSGTVEILSRHRLSQETYSKIFLHSSPMPVTPSSNQRPSIGTTVTVHDFFYNLPVRRRLIAADLELENIRQTVLNVALVNPSVSFSLKNDLVGECILQTRRTNSVLASFSVLFGSSKASCMKEISFEHEIFNITGYLSTESHHSKSLQFIYVNGRLVKKTALHSRVNNLIANSLIARCLSRQTDSKWRGGVGTDITSPRRVSEKHAVYVLMVRCPRAEYDVCLEPAKTLIEFRDWDLILDCLTQVVRQFLVKHSLTLVPGCIDGEEEEAEGEGGTGVAECEEHCSSEATTPGCVSVGQVSTSEGSSAACLDLVGEDINLATSGGLEWNTSSGEVTVTESDPIQPEKLSHTRTTPDAAMERRRSCKGDAEKHGLKKVGPAAVVLHLNGPARSPLNSRSTASKLAGFLRSEKPKLCVSRNTVLTSRRDVLPGCEQQRKDRCVLMPAGLSTAPASIGHDLQNSMPASIGHDRHNSMPRSICTDLQNSMPVNMGHYRQNSSMPASMGYDLQNSMSGHERPVSQKSMSANLSCGELLNTVPANIFCDTVPANLSCGEPLNTVPANIVCDTVPASMCCDTVPANIVCDTVPLSLSCDTVPASMCRELQIPNFHVPQNTMLCTSKQKGLDWCDLWSTMPRQDLCDLPTSDRHGLDLYSSSEQQKHHGPQNTMPAGERHSPDPLGPQQNVPANFVGCEQESCASILSCSSAGNVARSSWNSRINMQPNICSEHFPQTYPLAFLKPDTSSEHFPTTHPPTICSEQFPPTHPPAILQPGIRSEHFLPTHPPAILQPSICSKQFLPTHPPAILQPNTTSSEHFTPTNLPAILQPGICSEHFPPTHPPAILQTHNSSLRDHTLWLDPACTVSIDPTVKDLPPSTHATAGTQETQAPANFGTCTAPACLECQLTEHAKLLPSNSDSNLEDDGGSEVRAVDKEHHERSSGDRSVIGPRGIWKEVLNPITAQKVYVHSKTGNSYPSIPYGHSRTPESEDTGSTAGPGETRHSGGDGTIDGAVSPCYGAKPIQAAPHLSHDFHCFLPGAKRLKLGGSIDTSKSWPVPENGIDGSGDGRDEVWRDSIDGGPFESLLRNWKNPTFLPGQEDILGSRVDRKRSQIKVHNIINHYKFSKEMLDNAKILGQVDKKFIACMLNTTGTGQHNLLVCFDQHAAHERVRLEALHADLYESPSDPSSLLQQQQQPRVKSSTVHPPLLINLTYAEKKLARTFRKQLELLGVTLVQEGGSVGVASLPSVMMDREVSEVKRGRPAVALDMVQDMIVKHLEVLRATSGGCSAIPPSLTNVLNSQACHSAIKFGDPLTTEECSDLIRSLSKCKLPFQCAHGRPSVVPILDLEVLNKKYQHLQTPPSGELCKKLSAKLLSRSHE